MMEINQKIKRNIFIWAIFVPLALYAIPFTRNILSFILDYELINGINIITIIAFVSFLGLWFIHRRDL